MALLEEILSIVEVWAISEPVAVRQLAVRQEAIVDQQRAICWRNTLQLVKWNAVHFGISEVKVMTRQSKLSDFGIETVKLCGTLEAFVVT
jgi:hypothetical protein